MPICVNWFGDLIHNVCSISPEFRLFVCLFVSTFTDSTITANGFRNKFRHLCVDFIIYWVAADRFQFEIFDMKSLRATICYLIFVVCYVSFVCCYFYCYFELRSATCGLCQTFENWAWLSICTHSICWKQCSFLKTKINYLIRK